MKHIQISNFQSKTQKHAFFKNLNFKTTRNTKIWHELKPWRNAPKREARGRTRRKGNLAGKLPQPREVWHKGRRIGGDQERSLLDLSRGIKNPLRLWCKEPHSSALYATSPRTTTLTSDSRHPHSELCKRQLRHTLSASLKMSISVQFMLEELPSWARTCTSQEGSEVRPSWVSTMTWWQSGTQDTNDSDKSLLI